MGDALTQKSIAAVVAPPAQPPVCVTVLSYDGRMFGHLLYDELKISAGTARAMGDALMSRLREQS
jgi:hypothetical protein